ncbi:uncharacterized protein BO88DRAFT_405249, partial [Aspergillus vadensis CBS 113365]
MATTPANQDFYIVFPSRWMQLVASIMLTLPASPIFSPPPSTDSTRASSPDN